MDCTLIAARMSSRLLEDKSWARRAGQLMGLLFPMDTIAHTLELHYPDGTPLNVRIPIHTGAVIAGVIGQKKFAQGIWGDTVNVAQRLESTGVPGHIHVTENVYSKLKENFCLRAMRRDGAQWRGAIGGVFYEGEAK